MKSFNLASVFPRLAVIALAGIFSTVVQAHPQHAGTGVQHEEDIVKHTTTEPCISQQTTAAGTVDHQRTAPCEAAVMVDPDTNN